MIFVGIGSALVFVHRYSHLQAARKDQKGVARFLLGSTFVH
jgi:hypothetical protein